MKEAGRGLGFAMGPRGAVRSGSSSNSNSASNSSSSGGGSEKIVRSGSGSGRQARNSTSAGGVVTDDGPALGKPMTPRERVNDERRTGDETAHSSREIHGADFAGPPTASRSPRSNLNFDDPFEDGMRNLRERLQTLTANTVPVESGLIGAGFNAHDEAVMNLIGRNIATSEIERVRNDGERRIKNLEAMCQVVRRARARRLDEVRSRARVFDAMASGATARCRVEALGFERRLRLQLDTALKRLQELVFECLGETEKTLTRLEEASCIKEIDSAESHQRTVESLRWKLFLERLGEDALCNMSFKDISPIHEKALFSRLCEQFERDVSKILSGSKADHSDSDCAFERLALVRYDLLKGEPAETSVVKNLRNSNGNGIHRKSPAVAEDAVDTHGMLTTLFGDSGIRNIVKPPEPQQQGEGQGQSGEKPRPTVNFHRRLPKGSRRLPLYDSDVLLSSQSISWLLWPEYGRAPVRCHVYFCLEERSSKAHKPPRVGSKPTSVVEFLNDIYTSKGSEKSGGSALVNDDLEACYRRCLPDSTARDSADKQSAIQQPWPRGLAVDRPEGRHRKHYSLQQLDDDALETKVKSYPDVVLSEAPSSATCEEQAGKDASAHALADTLSADAASGAYHFAPASVSHLLETERFMDLNSRVFSAHDRATIREKYGSSVAHNAIRTLYAVLPREPARVSALNGLHQGTERGRTGSSTNRPDAAGEPLQIVPLPPQALDELIGCYVLRTANEDNNSKLLLEASRHHATLFPNKLDQVVLGDDGEFAPAGSHLSATSRSSSSTFSSSLKRSQSRRDSKQQTPKNSSKDSSALSESREYHALVACFTRRGSQQNTIQNDSRAATDIESSDNQTPLCLWRACNAPHSANNGIGLCEYHADFYERLIEEDPDEIKRHVPRQGLDALKRRRDVASVLKASSLISELLSSKLSSTVNGFCTRAANAARPRQQQGSRKGGRADPSIDAAERIRLAGLRKKSFLVEIDLATKVQGAERQVVAELEEYARLGVFPSDQLVAIRQEYKILNEEREALFAVDSSNSKASKRKKKAAEREPKRLFRSRAHLLDVEFERLVSLEKTNSPNQGLDEEGSGVLGENKEEEQSAQAMDAMSLGKSIQPVVKRERHLIEAELELEFCLRKIAILREKRLQLEQASLAGTVVPAHSGGGRSTPQSKAVSAATSRVYSRSPSVRNGHHHGKRKVVKK